MFWPHRVRRRILNDPRRWRESRTRVGAPCRPVCNARASPVRSRAHPLRPQKSLV